MVLIPLTVYFKEMTDTLNYNCYRDKQFLCRDGNRFFVSELYKHRNLYYFDDVSDKLIKLPSSLDEIYLISE